MTTYAPAQVASYLHQLGVPAPSPSLSLLQALARSHLLAVPFENLSLTYYPSPGAPPLSADALFHKLVVRRRGGYCMEVNSGLLALLQSLGFKAWATGAKVFRPDGVAGGWDHMVILVDGLEGGRVVVDVGFGGNGPTGVMRVGEEYDGVGKQRQRYVERERWVVLQIDEKGTGEWKDAYKFSGADVKFVREDFEVMNFATSAGFAGPFRKMVVCTKLIEEGGVLGRVTVVDGVWKKRVGEGLEERVLKSEEERVEALKEWFGIELDDRERQAVRGSALEIKVTVDG